VTYQETVKEGLTFTLFKGETDLLCVILTEKEEAEKVYLSLPSPKPHLISVTGYDWNGDLSPWKARRAFRGKRDFEGGAERFISLLTAELQKAEKEFALTPAKRYLAGYSLAGLCAVYALFVTDVFDGAVSASGSMWYDGFTDFMRLTPFTGTPSAAYLSVGDREKIARDPRLAKVEDETLKAAEILRKKGVETLFEINEGNHFTHPEIRLAKGVAALAAKLS